MIKNGQVFVNNILLPDNFISAKTNVWEGGFVKEGLPYKVPLNYVFVMGDNRPRSSDSREFGPLPVSSIESQAVFRYFPPGKTGWLKNPLLEKLRN